MVSIIKPILRKGYYIQYYVNQKAIYPFKLHSGQQKTLSVLCKRYPTHIFPITFMTHGVVKFL